MTATQINPKDDRPIGGRYRSDLGRNVEMILAEGVRIVRGQIPREVRRELMAAVKLRALVHLKKDGLLPEVFAHPDSGHVAGERRKGEAVYAASCIARVSLSFRNLTPADQHSRIIELSEAQSYIDGEGE